MNAGFVSNETTCNIKSENITHLWIHYYVIVLKWKIYANISVFFCWPHLIFHSSVCQGPVLPPMSACPCSVSATWAMWPGMLPNEQTSMWPQRCLLPWMSTNTPAAPTEQAAPSQTSTVARWQSLQWSPWRGAAPASPACLLLSSQVSERPTTEQPPNLLMFVIMFSKICLCVYSTVRMPLSCSQLSAHPWVWWGWRLAGAMTSQ